MADYINRDALIAEIERSWDWDSIDGITATAVLKQTVSDIKNYPAADVVDRKALRDALYEADAITFKGLAILDNFPAAAVRPEAHGHWVGVDDYPHEDWECDCCGSVFYSNESFPEESHYCPHCGAKMEV